MIKQKVEGKKERIRRTVDKGRGNMNNFEVPDSARRP